MDVPNQKIPSGSQGGWVWNRTQHGCPVASEMWSVRKAATRGLLPESQSRQLYSSAPSLCNLLQNENNHHTSLLGFSGCEGLYRQITYRSAWTIGNHSLIRISRDPQRCPVKQAGQVFHRHPLFTQGLRPRGVKHLADRVREH